MAQSGVYGGFSYLTANSPTDKQPPRSPRLSSRSSERDQDRGYPEESPSDPDLQPFTYLTPNSPSQPEAEPNILSDQRESYDNRIPQDGEHGYYPQSDRNRNNKVGSNPGYYTSVKDFTNNDGNRIHGELYDPRVVDEYEKRSAYIVPDQRQEPPNNYELSGGHIPRPKVGGNSSSHFDDPRSPRYTNREFNYFPDDPNSVSGGGINGKTRPITQESYLDSSHRRKGGCTPGIVCLVILLVILALGAGFAGGWFARQYLGNSDEGTTSTTATTAIGSQPPVTSPIAVSTPTTTITTTIKPTTTTSTTKAPTSITEALTTIAMNITT